MIAPFDIRTPTHFYRVLDRRGWLLGYYATLKAATKAATKAKGRIERLAFADILTPKALERLCNGSLTFVGKD